MTQSNDPQNTSPGSGRPPIEPAAANAAYQPPPPPPGAPHYPYPPHLQPAYAEMGLQQGALPISELIHREVVSLPMWPGMSRDQVETVVGAVIAGSR